MKPDSIDLSIIKLLRQDARMPYTKIAETLGISRVTAKNRVERMIKNEIITLSARMNLKKEGWKMAMLELEVTSEEQWEACIKKVKTLPWVLMGFRSLAKGNLNVLIYGESDEQLEKYINDFRYYPCVTFLNVTILGRPVVGSI